jgi:multisubunit Na+/H+ antiporter MnhB subunit
MEEPMTWSQWLFDLPLALALLWLAWTLLHSRDLFRAAVLFIAFGLLMALAWVRLHAVDIALAEAAIGAGITGALLLSTLRWMSEDTRREEDGGGGNAAHGGIRVSSSASLNILLVLIPAVLIGWALWSLPVPNPSPMSQVFSNMERSGVSNPVTAVLLNFRGYDTLLEIAVLFLALLGVWSLGTVDAPDQAQDAGPFLTALVRILLPTMMVTAGYLLWVGAHAPGGAFQAGAVLASAGILLVLTRTRFVSVPAGWPLRASLTLGLSCFVLVALVCMVLGGQLLEYPEDWAGPLILLIESLAALSIGATLIALFLGGRPPVQGGPESSMERDREVA